MCSLSILMFLFRHYIPLVFTSDAEVVDHFTIMMPFFAINFIPDSTQSVLSGLLKGLGEQGNAAKASLAANLWINLPLAYLLGIKVGLGLPGFWLGLSCGNIIVAVLYSCIAIRKNWTILAKKVHSEMS